MSLTVTSNGYTNSAFENMEGKSWCLEDNKYIFKKFGYTDNTRQIWLNESYVSIVFIRTWIFVQDEILNWTAPVWF